MLGEGAASRLSCAGPASFPVRRAAANAEPDIGNRFNQLPGRPICCLGCVRVSACEGVWEDLGGLWVCVCARAPVRVWCDCVGVSGACGPSMAPCPSTYFHLSKAMTPQFMVFLSPHHLGSFWISNPPITPPSCSLLSPTPPALRAYQSPELRLLYKLKFRCAFLSTAPSHLLTCLLPHPCSELTAVLFSLPMALCPTVL